MLSLFAVGTQVCSWYPGLYDDWKQHSVLGKAVPVAHLLAADDEKDKVWVGSWFLKAIAVFQGIDHDFIVLTWVACA